jgi:hypothetical protein
VTRLGAFMNRIATEKHRRYDPLGRRGRIECRIGRKVVHRIIVRRQNMMLISDQKPAALLGPCVPLRFLVRPESRTVPRQQMEGFSDSAIFHRWMDLFWTLGEPEAVALLTREEKGYLSEFNAVFASLAWRPIESHPHISEVAADDLSKLVPSATRLLHSLETRTRPSVLQRWWRQTLLFLRSG